MILALYLLSCKIKKNVDFRCFKETCSLRPASNYAPNGILCLSRTLFETTLFPSESSFHTKKERFKTHLAIQCAIQLLYNCYTNAIHGAIHRQHFKITKMLYNVLYNCYTIAIQLLYIVRYCEVKCWYSLNQSLIFKTSFRRKDFKSTINFQVPITNTLK